MLSEAFQIVESKEFKSFLVKAKKATYAGNGEEVSSSRVESHDLVYEEGDFIYRDSYFGKSAFSGQEVVYYKNKPIWSMVYYGQYDVDIFDNALLKKALSSISDEDKLPVRGPIDIITSGNDVHYQKYYNSYDPSASLSDFDGNEVIYDYVKKNNGEIEDEVAFICSYTGGLIKE